MKLTLTLVVCLTALTATLAADDLFLGRQYESDAWANSLAVCDLNRDGRQDVVLPDAQNDQLSIMIGNGDGTLRKPLLYPVGDGPRSIAVGDFLGRDGIEDVATANYHGGNVTVWQGVGDGRLRWPAISVGVGGTTPRGLVADDLDGDGQTDLVLCGGDGFGNEQLVLLFARPDGSGFDRETIERARNGPQVVAVGDLNEDEAPDLVYTNGRPEDSLNVMLNTGDGGFYRALSFPYAGGVVDIAIADVNLDGLPDIVAPHRDDYVWVFPGNGTGQFGNPAAYLTGDGPSSVAIDDVDRDGAPDIAVLYADAGTFQILWNRGDGTFALGALEVAGSQSTDVVLGDLNGDGWPDPLISRINRWLTVAMGRGDRGFALAANYPTVRSPRSLGAGDFNEDGRQDLFVMSRSSTGSQVLLGVGDGTFVPGENDSGRGNSELVVGDFNEDGHQDIFWTLGYSRSTEGPDPTSAPPTGNTPGTTSGTVVTPEAVPATALTAGSVYLKLGHGDGTFGPTQVTTVANRSNNPVGADLNLDGHLDTVAANRDQHTVTVLLGNGDGTFAEPRSFWAGGFVSSVALGDFDGDGCLDAFTPNRSTDSIRVLLGDCQGNLITQRRYPVGTFPSGSAVGDLNEDGFLDLVTRAEAMGALPRGLRILLGRGDGTFNDPLGIPFEPLLSRIRIADLNGDGHEDLAIDGEELIIMLGNGDATFGSETRYAAGHGAMSLLLEDFDGDGWVDAALANYAGESVAVFINQSDPDPDIEIDIKPGDSPSTINPRSRGVIPVAIYGTEGFDVIDVNVPTLAFGPGGASIAHKKAHYEDVNGDGLTDLVTHYRTQESGIACGVSSVTLTGELHDGYAFESSDSVETVGCGTRGQGNLARRPDSDRAREEDETRPPTTPERR